MPNQLHYSRHEMSAAVEIIRLSQPNFYNGYKTARKIIYNGTGSLALKIQATNALTGKPEANVTLTLTPTNGLLKSAAVNSSSNGISAIIKKTAAGGGSNYKNVPDGSYNLTAKKSGFDDVIATVNIVNGEMTVVNIRMGKG